jgi:hypothetical protein
VAGGAGGAEGEDGQAEQEGRTSVKRRRGERKVVDDDLCKRRVEPEEDEGKGRALPLSHDKTQG